MSTRESASLWWRLIVSAKVRSRRITSVQLSPAGGIIGSGIFLKVSAIDQEVPSFALIMAMISAPFAFLVGNRGAMAGIGASIGVAVVYLAIGQIFEKIGNVNYLPAAIAAWSPNAIFSLAGMYLLLKMRS